MVHFQTYYKPDSVIYPGGVWGPFFVVFSVSDSKCFKTE